MELSISFKREVAKWPRKLMRQENGNSFWAYCSPLDGIYVDEDYVDTPEKKEGTYTVVRACANCGELNDVTLPKGTPVKGGAYHPMYSDVKCKKCECAVLDLVEKKISRDRHIKGDCYEPPLGKSSKL